MTTYYLEKNIVNRDIENTLSYCFHLANFLFTNIFAK